MIGQTISHYKILAKLGEGGMGVVYKAEDTVLQRPVALKFLLARLAGDPVAKQRFITEARAASMLNHPNICIIHSVEEVEGQPFICMEFVDGQTLADFVAKAALAIPEILDIAIQIGCGLNEAHAHGIFHRDLKPGNIMVTHQDLVKVMDFGLARVSGQPHLSRSGSTLGTAAYMSPEQAQGKLVDHRSDIFSFGTVLYEMTAGQPPFAGEYEAEVMYTIVNEAPASLTELHKEMPAEFERIVFKCLEKEREDRYQTVEQLLIDFKNIQESLSLGERASENLRHSARTKTPKPVLRWAVLATSIVLTLALVIIVSRLSESKVSAPRIIQARALTTTTTVQEVAPKLSPDGTKVAYASREEGKWDLCVRQIASEQTMNLTKDEKGSVAGFAWSPDGNWIAYISARNGGGIYVISDYGGAARRVVAHDFEDLWNINWSSDGKKLVYTVNWKLYAVLASGGVPEHIPCPQYVREPAWSPDGRRIVLISGASWSSHIQQNYRQRIWTIRLDGSDAIAVTDTTGSLFTPFWAHDGKRIFFKWNPGGVRDIWWVPVDKNGKPTGSARPLTTGLNTFDFSLSNDGSKLAYSTGGHHTNIWSLPLGTDRVLTMDDAVQITHENQFIRDLAISPDHDWFAFCARRGGPYAIWLARKDGQELRQLTTDNSSSHLFPSWSPDGRRIAFSSDQGGNMDIYMIPVDGGPATASTANSAEIDAFPSWSPDGRKIVFTSNRSGNFDLWETSVSGGETRQLTDDQADDVTPHYSPDGRFISFVSKRKGAWDLYLLPAGGGEPKQLTHVDAPKMMGHVWSPDGKTIYLRHYGPGKDEPKIHLQAVAVPDGSMRRILEMEYFELEENITSLATDGEKLYFIVHRPIGDIWLAELAYE